MTFSKNLSLGMLGDVMAIWICQEKQIETRTGDIAVVRWSKPSGDYIMNFYRPKGVFHKKTESGGHTRWPQA
jgi:hypothetical protein